MLCCFTFPKMSGLDYIMLASHHCQFHKSNGVYVDVLYKRAKKSS